MNITTYLGLKKYETSDPADFRLLNSNWDVMDAKFAHYDTVLADQQPSYNMYKSGKDSNGIYTVIDYKRSNGTLYMKSTLSGGTSPNYTTDTWQYYDTFGTTVIKTSVWTITYDVDGLIVSKVVS